MTSRKPDRCLPNAESEGGMAYDDFTAKMVRRVCELENALAEKDREIEQLKHSLFEVAEKLGPYKANYEAGVAAWQPVYEELQHKMSKKDQAYHALMAQAVRFAECLQDCPSPCIDADMGNCQIAESRDFLASPEVREWREQQGE